MYYDRKVLCEPSDCSMERMIKMSEYIEPSEVNESEIQTPQPSKLHSVLKEILSWIVCIGVALGIAFVLRTYVFMNVKVDGSSMNPTLQNGQRLFARIIGYTPERGDIIIFHPKHNDEIAYVKRVIATAGDRIWIDDTNGKVHLKKKGSSEWEILDEPYIANEVYNSLNVNCAQRYSDDSGEEGILIEEDHIFVLGDNRNHSNDSRNDTDHDPVGQVHVDSVIGKASFSWWPLDEFGSIY